MAVHGVVIAVLAARAPVVVQDVLEEKPVEIEVIEPEPTPEPEPEPVDVVMLSAPQLEKLVASATPSSTTTSMPRPRVNRIASRSTTPSAEVVITQHDINPLFGMRGHQPAQIDLRTPQRDAIDNVPRGTDVAIVPSSGELAPNGRGTYRSEKGTFTAIVNRDGTVKIKDGANLKRNGIGASFDVTDALMRRQKIDPYAAAKLRYLDSTRDERVEIGKRYRKQQLAQSAELMQKQLDLLARATLAQKKQALFELWDDCAETGDEALVEGARQARILVMGYIRAHVTYTADELAALNRKKQSKAAFAP